MISLQSKNSSHHHQAAFNSLKINLKLISIACKWVENQFLVRAGGKLLDGEDKKSHKRSNRQNTSRF